MSIKAEIVVDFYPRYNKKFETRLVIEKDECHEFHYFLVLDDDVCLSLTKEEFLDVKELFNGVK